MEVQNSEESEAQISSVNETIKICDNLKQHNSSIEANISNEYESNNFF